MKNLISILLILLSIKGISQVQSIGAYSGISSTNQTGSLFSNSKNKLGIIEGVSYEVRFKNSYLLGVDVQYSQKGFIYCSDVSNNQDEINLAYDYVSLPIKIGYQLGEKFVGFAKLGLYPSLLVNSKSALSVFNENGDLVVDLENDISKFEMGSSVEIGAGYQFRNQIELFSTLSFYHGLTAFTNTKRMEDVTLRHYGFSLALGVKYILAGKN